MTIYQYVINDFGTDELTQVCSRDANKARQLLKNELIRIDKEVLELSDETIFDYSMVNEDDENNLFALPINKMNNYLYDVEVHYFELEIENDYEQKEEIETN